MRILLKKFTYLSFILICIGFVTLSLSMDRNMYTEPSIHGKALYGFIAKMGRELGKKYKMSPIGPGGGATPEGIWLMMLSFEREGNPLTEGEARQLIIDCVDDFLNAVNNDRELKPFLKIYPFTAKNLRLTIFNYDKKRVLHYFPSIAVVTSSKGEIGYLTEDPSTIQGYHTEKYETHEEAVAILKNAH